MNSTYKSSPVLGIFTLFNINHCSRCVVVCLMVLIYISLMANDDECLFMCSLAICISPLEKCSQFSFNLGVITNGICFSNVWGVRLRTEHCPPLSVLLAHRVGTYWELSQHLLTSTTEVDCRVEKIKMVVGRMSASWLAEKV